MSKTITELKAEINAMSQIEMACKWRFAALGDSMFQGEVGAYFGEVFAEKGGMTPAISKEIGWDRE